MSVRQQSSEGSGDDNDLGDATGPQSNLNDEFSQVVLIGTSVKRDLAEGQRYLRKKSGNHLRPPEML